MIEEGYLDLKGGGGEGWSEELWCVKVKLLSFFTWV